MYIYIYILYIYIYINDFFSKYLTIINSFLCLHVLINSAYLFNNRLLSNDVIIMSNFSVKQNLQ